MYTRADTRVSSVSVDIPEAWEGERALMTCTFTLINKDDTGWRLTWTKGNTQLKYKYIRTINKVVVNNLGDRFKGELDGNVYKLYIDSVSLTDEDTYRCDVSTIHDQRELTVNGEYSAKSYHQFV